MDNCDLNVFEFINLAIQVASRLYPAELALRRDRIIERLYNSSDVMAHDAARVPGKKARVSAKGGGGSSCQCLISGQGVRFTYHNFNFTNLISFQF